MLKPNKKTLLPKVKNKPKKRGGGGLLLSKRGHTIHHCGFLLPLQLHRIVCSEVSWSFSEPEQPTFQQEQVDDMNYFTNDVGEGLELGPNPVILKGCQPLILYIV